MKRRLSQLRTLYRLGPESLSRIARHRIRLKVGRYTALTPEHVWGSLADSYLANATSPFAPPNPDQFTLNFPNERDSAIAMGDRIVQGEMYFFSHHWLPRPIDWRTNPQSKYPTAIAHWTAFSDFATEQGDIKWIWEPSRFDWVYVLGRAWVYSQDPAYLRCFWRLLEEWRSQNPPNQSINWKCGQECSLRLFALVWAAGVFPETQTAASPQHCMLWETVARLAERIEVSLDYAIAQNNNHALSEASALYVAGCCLPSHPRAARWKQVGRSLLTRLILAQFASDGSYVQHSHNYTRLALRVTFLALYTAQKFHEPFSKAVQERLLAAVSLLYQMQSHKNGRVPNYGHNDGSNIMALSDCDYFDYRPVLTSFYYLVNQRRIYSHGPWEEELLWHFGAQSLGATYDAPSQSNCYAREGGYFVLREGRSTAIIRCHAYRTRPSQADMLHLDYWYDGQPILIDAGTYSYNVPEPWYSYFGGTSVHNTVTVDRRDQMPRASRFLWLDWIQARTNKLSTQHTNPRFDGEHSAYAPVTHRRQVEMVGEVCQVYDTLTGDGGIHTYRLHWALEDLPFEMIEDEGMLLRISIAAQQNLAIWVRVKGTGALWNMRRGTAEPPQGWQSLYYGERTPALSFEGIATSSDQVCFITLIGPEAEVLALRRTLPE